MEKLSKADVQSIYNQCYRLVKRKPPEFFIFEKLKVCGLCIYDEDVIKLDHRKDVIRTAYHECVHYLYPNWSETKVIYTESRLINSVSILNTIKFMKIVLEKLYKSELYKILKESKNKNPQKNLKKKLDYGREL
jgi:hypothetical protein